MKIEDLIQLLNNRLREYKLSKNYAAMNGDIERVNTADIEIIGIEDTLFKLNLLIDTSKSAAVKETTLAEVITDGSVAVLGEYDITPYATDPLHEQKIMNILSKMGVMDTAEKIDGYIKGKYLSSPVTGEMIVSAAEAYVVDVRLMMAIMEQDSSFGTAGLAVRTLNPGNVGNDDDGNIRTYASWQAGVTAVAEWLGRHRASKIISEIPAPLVTTSTPSIITPFTTTTTSIATSTPTTSTTTTTPAFAATTSTPETVPVTTSTTTTTIATSTPITATSTPVIATVSEETVPVTTSTTTTTIATSTPTNTSAPALVETVPVTTSTTTPAATTATEEALPVTTSTTTTTTALSTPATTTTTPVVATTGVEETVPVTTSTTTTTIATSTQ